MESERILINKIQNQQDEKDDSGIEQDNSFIYIRISVEDHNLQVRFFFYYLHLLFSFLESFKI